MKETLTFEDAIHLLFDDIEAHGADVRALIVMADDHPGKPLILARIIAEAHKRSRAFALAIRFNRQHMILDVGGARIGLAGIVTLEQAWRYKGNSLSTIIYVEPPVLPAMIYLRLLIRTNNPDVPLREVDATHPPVFQNY